MTTTRLFVGGLSPITEEVHLVNYFSKFGRVLDAKVVVDATGRNKGVGFVTIYGGDACGILSECHIVGGRVVTVTLYYPNMRKTTLLTNLDDSIKLDKLWPHFGYYGRVVAINQHPDPFMRLLNTIHCYVTFEDADGFRKVVKQHHFWICGILLKVRPACETNGGQTSGSTAQQPDPLESRMLTQLGYPW
uniref:heterogeneous nuclear ribonucleoprotein A/B-like n=1 Tax=Erigeron canadensis TaxID=72917 RepID=UPI001CB8BBB7|nr:heterogeneous nuclear ribonucleoprotein A/B-like [Erigeron canadensis]